MFGLPGENLNPAPISINTRRSPYRCYVLSTPEGNIVCDDPTRDAVYCKTAGVHIEFAGGSFVSDMDEPKQLTIPSWAPKH